ncbi:MAG TPA: penicillin-binding protein 2 [Solirubrobacteraceae bacterium]|nr:penicillin-binding protein 2 [Solirubrobacteraceae bacterium]
MANVQARVGVLFAAFCLLLAAAAARTLYLGVLHGAALRKVANSQQVTMEAVPAQRGTITDRSGVVLAISEPAQDISATPYLVKHPLEAAQRLAPLLGRPRAQVLEDLNGRGGFVYLARALPAARAKAVLALGIPGVTGTPTMRRVYPRGALAGQVLGMMGTAAGTAGEGLSGLEYSDNAILKGSTGERRVVSDARGEPISITNVRSEAPGAQLQLTLDANIQQRSEAVLAAVGKLFHPKDATAIVLNPDTGGILAMANWPQLNPNKREVLAEGELENRAVSFDYEPGSTFKAVAVSGGLQENLITPNTEFNVPDQIHVADRTIHDAEVHPEEMLSTARILAQSSNVGAIEIGKLEGASRFNEWVRRFGFGTRTGIDLPAEEMGRRLKLSEYSGSSMGNLPIGQGELVTPMQMAEAYAAIANGGFLRTPRVVAAIDGHPTPLPRGRRVISQNTAAQVREMLKGVLAPGGTASEVSVPGYTLAGKTGTASKVNPATGQYSETAYVASFMGFAPASNPKLLCAVIVDEPQGGSIYGGTVAAPAFGQIMAFALPYLGIPPG